MWATYNYDRLPNVHVTISGVIENDDDFSDFIERWLSLFNSGEKFNFIFDTTNVSYVPFKYSIRMSEFIRRLKKDYSYHYLQKNIIIPQYVDPNNEFSQIAYYYNDKYSLFLLLTECKDLRRRALSTSFISQFNTKVISAHILSMLVE